MVLGKPIKTKIVIDGITIKDDDGSENYITGWSMVDTDKSDFIRQINIIAVRAITDVFADLDALIGKPILVYRGVTTSTDNYIFRGFVTEVVSIGGNINIICADKLYTATKRIITYSFDKDIDSEAGNISEIFKTLINDYTDLTADSTSVQATSKTISKFICKADTVYSKCKKLAETLSWLFYYNPVDDKVHFEPKGYVNNTTTIEEGVNLLETPKWSTDESALYNKVRLDGAVKQAQTTIEGVIGTTSGFTIEYIQLDRVPISSQVYCDSSNPPTTQRVFGVPNNDTNYDYYYDETKKQIKWNITDYTPSNGDYCKVIYTYSKPVPILVSDSNSINNYGVKEISMVHNDIKDVNDARTYATQYLSDHKNPIVSTSLKVTNISDLEIGQKVHVIDYTNNKNDYYKITRLSTHYPYSFDEINITSDILNESDYELSIENRLDELEKQNMDDFNTLVEVKTFDNSMIYENRYLHIKKNVLTGTTGIFDNDEFGIWDTSTFYDPADTPFVLGSHTYGILGSSHLGAGSIQTIDLFLENSEKTYVELFYDTEFKNSSTTSDWDTVNEWVHITSTDEVISKSFVYDIENSDDNAYKSVDITIEGTDVDKLEFYIGEYDNTSVTYTQVALTGTSSSVTGSLALSNMNKYGLNWKAKTLPTINPFPTAFGTWGNMYNTYITKLKVKYTK